MKRRNVLLGSAAVGTSVLALFGLESLLNADSDSEGSDDEVRVNRISAMNGHDEPHDLTLVVQYDGNEIHDEQFRLGTSGDAESAAIEALPTEPGVYHVTATLEDGQTVRVEPEYYAGRDCADRFLVTIDADGNLGPFLSAYCTEQSN